MMDIYFQTKQLYFLALTSILVSVCLIDVNCETGVDNFFGKNKELKEDVDRYLQALEVFDKTNSSFESLTSSIRHLFKYIDILKQDELCSVLFAYPKLRPDIFPIVEERRTRQKAFPVGKSMVCIRRKDDFLFMIFAARAGIDWMFKNIRFGEGQLFYRGIEDPIKDLVVVQLNWPRIAKFKGNRTLTAEFRWGALEDKKNIAVLTQEFNNSGETKYLKYYSRPK
nr:PREDICTED: uncharacterized protein LOC109044015 isoform X1 [Bemisia tabaci]